MLDVSIGEWIDDKSQVMVPIFIGPKSDHCLALSLTNWLLLLRLEKCDFCFWRYQLAADSVADADAEELVDDTRTGREFETEVLERFWTYIPYKFREKTVSASASPVFFLEILSPSLPILGHNWKHDLARSRSCIILNFSPCRNWAIFIFT